MGAIAGRGDSRSHTRAPSPTRGRRESSGGDAAESSADAIEAASTAAGDGDDDADDAPSVPADEPIAEALAA